MDVPTKNENPLRWDEKGVPHSILFRDKYFCTQNGYEESSYVSDQGNQLRERFSSLDPKVKRTFTVLETGFGTGLSFCCVWQLWRATAPLSWKLHFVSVELYPLSTSDLVRALNAWPVLESFKLELEKQYKPFPKGIKNFNFQDPKVQLTIAFDDVVEALKQIYRQQILTNPADAILLNGFSPFSNPLMWTEDVFKALTLLCKPGTTVSSFSVAGHVRRGLEAQGFKVEKFPGHGTKKEMLRGRFV